MNQLLLTLVKMPNAMAMDNTEFIVADAAVEMPKLYKAGVRPDVIVFDPIRAGCKEEVLTSAACMEPKRIVYVSCNPATMARDIEILTHYGYELKEVQPVDMFPHTPHVENVVYWRNDKRQLTTYLKIAHYSSQRSYPLQRLT